MCNVLCKSFLKFNTLKASPCSILFFKASNTLWNCLQFTTFQMPLQHISKAFKRWDEGVVTVEKETPLCPPFLDFKRELGPPLNWSPPSVPQGQGHDPELMQRRGPRNASLLLVLSSGRSPLVSPPRTHEGEGYQLCWYALVQLSA